jgi:CheY-like chemotaxis protein
LAAAKEFKPELVLLDVVMPDKDGGDIAREILSDDSLKNIQVVFMTAIVKEDEIDSGNGGLIGGHPFIAKPITKAKLIAVVKKYI